MTRRLDPVLTCFDVLCAVRDAALDRIRGRKCAWCFERSRAMTTHIYVNHSGEEL